MQTPSYIKSLLIKNGKQPLARRVWSIDLQLVWLPFFTATNTVGDTHIAPDALGCPLRLGYDKDGSVKFSKSGRPVTKVAKELSDNIRLIRDNFTAGLVSYSEQVAIEHAEGYMAQLEVAKQAGEPISAKDRNSLALAQADAMEKVIAEAEAQAKPKGRKAKAEVELVGVTA